MKNRYLMIILLGVASIWVYGQGVPLESSLLGQTRASTHNLDLISVGDASVTDATITNATVSTFHSVQGFPFELVGGASGEVLAVQEDLAIRPTDPNFLVTWPAEDPAFAHIVADVTRISATNSASQITILEGTNVAFTVDEANSKITITSLANGSTNPAYSSIAVAGQKADATSPASQFTLIEGSNIDLTLDTVNHNLEILAQATGYGNGVPTVVVAASDSLNKASADYICDGTDDDVEINAALNRIDVVGGVCFLMEGAFKISSPIVLATPGLELRGSGWHSVINAGTNCVASSGYILAGSSGVGVKGIRIVDLTIRGNQTVYTSANNNGIWVDNACQFRIDHVRVMDCKANGIYIDEPEGGPSDDWQEVSVVWIGNSLMRSNGGDGLYINGTGGITVTGCMFYGNGDDGMEMSMADDGIGVAITGCLAYDNSGWGFYSPMAYSTLSGCNAMYNDGGDIYLGGNNTCSGSQSVDSSADGIVIGGNNVVLTGAYVYSPNGDGIVIEANVDNVLINGCFVNGPADDGIIVNSGCDQVMISNCWITAGGKGVILSGNWTGLSSNYIYGCAENAVYADGDSDIIQNNFFYDNGGAGSDAVIHVVNDDYIVIQKNRFIDWSGSSPLVELDSDGADDIQFPYITGNYAVGTWAATTIDDTSNGNIGYSDFMQQLNGAADQYILAGSAGARIGIATRININNVLTVSSSAPTNPIANSWDTWSDPGLKENMEAIPPEDRITLKEEFRQLDSTAIQFDWRYHVPEPKPTDFEDVKDETGTVLATAQEQYDYALDGYQRGLAEWKATPGKTNQRGWNIADPNFPDRLKSYDVNGKAVGINTSQMIFELYNAVQTGIDDLEALKKEVEELKAR